MYLSKSFFFVIVILKMYSIRRDSETKNCLEQQSIFNNYQMIKTKQYFFSSTKFYDNTNKPKDILPVYQTPCTFQKDRKGEKIICSI